MLPRKDHVPELDGLRAIAVLQVLWVHLPPLTFGAGGRAVARVLGPGDLGVDLFFVLSGFLITRILLVDRGAGVPLRHFLARRFLRIFPIYYLLLAVTSPWLSGQELGVCATYLANYGLLFKDSVSHLEHTWSLSIEEHFYLLWPPLVMLLEPRTSRRVLLLGLLPLAFATWLAALFLGDWTREAAFWQELVLRGSTTRFASLGVGALIAYHEGALRALGRRVLWPSVLCLALAAALSRGGLQAIGLEGLLSRFEPFASSYPRAQGSLRWIAAPCISAALILPAIAWSGSAAPLPRLLRAPLLRALGRISYGVYLYHFPLFRALRIEAADGSVTSYPRLVLALALTFAVASLSYRFLERPLLRFAARFRGKPAAMQRTAAPANGDGGPSDTAV